MKRKKSLILALTLATGITYCQAAVIYTSATDASATASVATDLLQTNLDLTDWQVNNNINNGTTGANGDNDGVNPANVVAGGSVYTFFLDVTTNTLGYDISQVDVFTGWIDNRAGQTYTVAFSTVGSATFTDVLSVSESATATSLVTHVMDDGAALLGTGVDAIRFTIGATDGTEDVYREVDVIGSATAVPEPSSAALFGIGGLALILRRRK